MKIKHPTIWSASLLAAAIVDITIIENACFPIIGSIVTNSTRTALSVFVAGLVATPVCSMTKIECA